MIVSQVDWQRWSTQTLYRPSSWLLDPSSSWALVIRYFPSLSSIPLPFFDKLVLFLINYCCNLQISPQLSTRWEAITTSRICTCKPFLTSRETSAQTATSLGQTPSIFSGMPSQETCRGPASSLDSLSRPPGTGALIRSVTFSFYRQQPMAIKTHIQNWFSCVCTHIYASLSRLFLPESLKQSEVASHDTLLVRP